MSELRDRLKQLSQAITLDYIFALFRESEARAQRISANFSTSIRAVSSNC
ncbi:MAG: hypothetical protein ACK5EU_00530 [Pseudanabaena sp.]|nr:hypothetical protein [Pseudanabaena sp. M53BS1SP1A06MG]MCA6586295.1 hypothetical protein [Pseudanabaena sp. M051S1SP1A06QC]MCA6621172.1 hypothetical protein [Pseudanabaena sp. M165S2SP1A06QC]